MNLYRTSDSGLVPIQPLADDETAGLAGTLLRGRGGALGAEELLFVTTSEGEGTASALALDAEGTAVVVGAADAAVGSDVVTDALQRASAVADADYDALAARFEDGALREAHADYFERDPLAPGAFNDDQRVRLLGTTFESDALDLASFLSDRDLAVDPVRVEAFGDPASDEFLVQFETDEDDGEPADGEAEPDGAGSDQWVAGTSTAASVDAESEAATPETEHEETPETGHEEPEEPESLELPGLLEAVADGVEERLVGTFDGNPERLVSIERGNELLVRPDDPAYAGGVLRYRLRADAEGSVEFGVTIYGGSEAEKEQMRALIRENEGAIEEELGYETSDRYDGFHANREFPSFDQVAAAEIVDEFDRLVRFFHPRVSRA